jgi:hypothetical protein
MSPERLLVIADVLAKSVALAHDEREVAKVFEIIEPFAKELADRGRTRRNRKGILQLIGNTLLVQHRVSGRVAIGEKPDALWDRPDLERLYARLEDEYELRERVDALNRKLAVVAETANTLADIIDTRRSLRLELIVVALIAFEIVITFYQIYAAKGSPTVKTITVRGVLPSTANEPNRSGSIDTCAQPLTRDVLPEPGIRNNKATLGSRTTLRSESTRLLPRRSGIINVFSSWTRMKPGISPRGEQSSPSGPQVASAANGDFSINAR